MHDLSVFDVVLISVILIIVLLLVFMTASFIRRKYGANSASGLPAVSLETGVIADAAQSGTYINNQPVLVLQVAVFPQNGPMEMIKVRQVFSLLGLSAVVNGTPVSVSYSRQKNGKIKHARIVEVTPAIWEGDPDLVNEIKTLSDRLTQTSVLTAQGTIQLLQESGVRLSGKMLYRCHVNFLTQAGSVIEGDTFQTCRPWLLEYRRTNTDTGVIYNPSRPKDFVLERM